MSEGEQNRDVLWTIVEAVDRLRVAVYESAPTKSPTHIEVTCAYTGARMLVPVASAFCELTPAEQIGPRAKDLARTPRSMMLGASSSDDMRLAETIEEIAEKLGQVR